MKTKIWMAMIALSMTFFIVACDDDDDDNPVTPSLEQYDVNFLNRSTQSNLAEIQLSRIALDSATNPGVTQYAQDMINDHQAAQRQLDSIGVAFSLALPTTIDTSVAMLRDSLKTMARGRDFDTSYMGMQSRMHAMTLQDLVDAAANAKNDRVKNYANQMIPVITTHRNRADSLFGSL
jgi:putative membrane protein